MWVLTRQRFLGFIQRNGLHETKQSKWTGKGGRELLGSPDSVYDLGKLIIGLDESFAPGFIVWKSNGVLVPMEEGFGACVSHAVWLGSGLDSYSGIMTSHLTEFINSVNGTLDLSVTQGPERDFARDMLHKIDKGWSAFTLC
jgi:hypothetical protein